MFTFANSMQPFEEKDEEISERFRKIISLSITNIIVFILCLCPKRCKVTFFDTTKQQANQECSDLHIFLSLGCDLYTISKLECIERKPD